MRAAVAADADQRVQIERMEALDRLIERSLMLPSGIGYSKDCPC